MTYKAIILGEIFSFSCAGVYVGRSTLVGQRPTKSFLSICLSVRLSVCPFVNKFSQDLIIVHDDSWP